MLWSGFRTVLQLLHTGWLPRGFFSFAWPLPHPPRNALRTKELEWCACAAIRFYAKGADNRLLKEHPREFHSLRVYVENPASLHWWRQVLSIGSNWNPSLIFSANIPTRFWSILCLGYISSSKKISEIGIWVGDFFITYQVGFGPPFPQSFYPFNICLLGTNRIMFFADYITDLIKYIHII